MNRRIPDKPATNRFLMGFVYGMVFLFLTPIAIGTGGVSSEFIPAWVLWGVLLTALALPVLIQRFFKLQWKKRNLVLLIFVLYPILLWVIQPIYHNTEAYKGYQAKTAQYEKQKAAHGKQEDEQPSFSEKPALSKTTVDKTLGELEKSGFIMEYRPDSSEVLVNPVHWSMLTYSQREKMVYLFSAYCEHYCAVKGKLVYLKDGYSGKKLADYGMFGPHIETE